MMNERCVVCNSGTYEDHSNLLEWLQQQFWQRIPVRLLSWVYKNRGQQKRISFLACRSMQNSILQKIIFDPLTIKYSPSNRYIVSFLKLYIGKLEEGGYEITDDLIEFYVSLMATLELENKSSSFVYQTYVIDQIKKTKITLKVDQNEISNGTTGLRPWGACISLVDFLLMTPELINNKSILELGAGSGLLGLTCSALGASKVLMTDLNLEVLKLCNENVVINSSLVKNVEVMQLDWSDTNHQKSVPKNYDIILGSDLVYDPDIIPHLVKTVESLLVTTDQIAYIASIVRRQETFNEFISLLEKSMVLSVSTIDISDINQSLIHTPMPNTTTKLSIIARKDEIPL